MMKKICFLLLLTSLTTSYLQAQWLWNIQKMETIKTDLNSLNYVDAYRLLIAQADRAMDQKGYSVTAKKGVAPSGNKHDYVSLSRYWWPNPDTDNKLPYLYKDGQSNPELEHYDRNSLGTMCAAVNSLSLAFFYSGQEKYAKKAVDFLRIWFMNSETKMNPNLEYAQFIPGKDDSKGRPEGLIDSYSFVTMLNSVQLLKLSDHYTDKDETLLKQWFQDFAQWYQISEQGMKERNAKNNHATAYDAQLINYLLFSGDEQAARAIINEFPERRIFAQIEPDGKQPNELWRTLAYHYSYYNLSHMLDVCATAKHLGIDLINQKSTDGRSIYGGINYLISFLGQRVDSWPYKQINGWESKQQDVCADLLRVTEIAPTQSQYQSIFKKYTKHDKSNRFWLLYGVIE